MSQDTEAAPLKRATGRVRYPDGHRPVRVVNRAETARGWTPTSATLRISATQPTNDLVAPTGVEPVARGSGRRPVSKKCPALGARLKRASCARFGDASFATDLAGRTRTWGVASEFYGRTAAQ